MKKALGLLRVGYNLVALSDFTIGQELKDNTSHLDCSLDLLEEQYDGSWGYPVYEQDTDGEVKSYLVSVGLDPKQWRMKTYIIHDEQNMDMMVEYTKEQIKLILHIAEHFGIETNVESTEVQPVVLLY